MTFRLLIFRRLLVIGLGCLVLRLGYLQLLRGSAYRQLAEQNRLRLLPQPAARGLILDRFGRRLATNQLTFRVAVIPQESDRLSEVFTTLGPLVNRSASGLQRASRQRSQ